MSKEKNDSPISLGERNVAMMAFFAKGKKITKCPPKVARDAVWLGGIPEPIRKEIEENEAKAREDV